MLEREKHTLEIMILELIEGQDNLEINEERADRWEIITHLGRAVRVIGMMEIKEKGGE